MNAHALRQQAFDRWHSWRHGVLPCEDCDLFKRQVREGLRLLSAAREAHGVSLHANSLLRQELDARNADYVKVCQALADVHEIEWLDIAHPSQWREPGPES